MMCCWSSKSSLMLTVTQILQNSGQLRPGPILSSPVPWGAKEGLGTRLLKFDSILFSTVLEEYCEEW